MTFFTSPAFIIGLSCISTTIAIGVSIIFFLYRSKKPIIAVNYSNSSEKSAEKQRIPATRKHASAYESPKKVEGKLVRQNSYNSVNALLVTDGVQHQEAPKAVRKTSKALEGSFQKEEREKVVVDTDVDSPVILKPSDEIQICPVETKPVQAEVPPSRPGPIEYQEIPPVPSFPKETEVEFAREAKPMEGDDIPFIDSDPVPIAAAMADSGISDSPSSERDLRHGEESSSC